MLFEKDIASITSTITGRNSSLFENDVKANNKELARRLDGKNVLVIGGAGTIGSAFIKEILNFNISTLTVFDLNENGLAELVRDVRNSNYPSLPKIMTYPISFGSETFERYIESNPSQDIVANFAALKHVRSEKDAYSIERMFENNVLYNFKLIKILERIRPEHFFCVSTDKATNPVNFMGASKKLMEDVLFSFSNNIKITTARFANVAFSNGSLLESYYYRIRKQQGLVCPKDISRYFVSKQEAGQLCLLTCLLGENLDIFTPNLDESQITNFSETLLAFLKYQGLTAFECNSDEHLLEEVRRLQYHLDKKQYPCYFFSSDTSGEKPFEEFYTSEDILDHERFENINVIKNNHKSFNLDSAMFEQAQMIFDKGISKENLVQFFNEHVPDFKHVELGKNLDEKI